MFDSWEGIDISVRVYEFLGGKVFRHIRCNPQDSETGGPTGIVQWFRSYCLASCSLERRLLWRNLRCKRLPAYTKGKVRDEFFFFRKRLIFLPGNNLNLVKQTKNEQLANNFVAGTIGGTVGTILNTPMDVVKTRIQGHVGTGPKKYNWTWPSLALVAKEEG